MNGVRLEFFKMRHRRIALVCMALLGAQLLWEGVDLLRTAVENRSWYGICYDLIILDAVMLPLTVAVIASRNSEGEHKGSCFKQSLTMTTPTRLYFSKLLWGALVVALVLGVRLLAFVGIGIMLRFPGEVPWHELLLYHLGSWVVSVMIYALQQGLSLRFANQAVALIGGLAGSFLGLMSEFFPYAVARCLPWGYYGLMGTVRIDYDAYVPHQGVPFLTVTPQLLDVGLLVVWTLVFVTVGWALFARKEV